MPEQYDPGRVVAFVLLIVAAFLHFAFALILWSIFSGVRVEGFASLLPGAQLTFALIAAVSAGSVRVGEGHGGLVALNLGVISLIIFVALGFGIGAVPALLDIVAGVVYIQSDRSRYLMPPISESGL